MRKLVATFPDKERCLCHGGSQGVWNPGTAKRHGLSSGPLQKGSGSGCLHSGECTVGLPLWNFGWLRSNCSANSAPPVHDRELGTPTGSSRPHKLLRSWIKPSGKTLSAKSRQNCMMSSCTHGHQRFANFLFAIVRRRPSLLEHQCHQALQAAAQAIREQQSVLACAQADMLSGFSTLQLGCRMPRGSL